MDDLAYRWNDGKKSVDMSKEVALPDLKVLGHRLNVIEASLGTGM